MTRGQREDVDVGCFVSSDHTESMYEDVLFICGIFSQNAVNFCWLLDFALYGMIL
jgi:hypothetical protein